MTALWLLVVAVAAAAGLVQAARRGSPARRAARTHHRVLDTLDTITRQGSGHGLRDREAEDARTHVRLFRSDVPPPAPPAARVVSPGRSLGAAPFRAPVARHALDVDAISPVAPPVGDERVTLVRASVASSPPAEEASGLSDASPDTAGSPVDERAVDERAVDESPVDERLVVESLVVDGPPQPGAPLLPLAGDPAPAPAVTPSTAPPSEAADDWVPSTWLDEHWDDPWATDGPATVVRASAPNDADHAPDPDASMLRFDADADPAPTVASGPPPGVSHLSPATVAALATSGRQRLEATATGRGGRHRAVRPASRRPRSRRPRSRRGPGRGSPPWPGAPVPALLVAAAAIVIVGALAAVATISSGGSSPIAAVKPSPAVTSTVPTPTTTTTVPSSPATLVSSTGSDAVYSLTGPASITFTASSGVSWIEMRQGSETGAIVFEGNLIAGHAQTTTGPAWVRLGNPTAVTISVNRTAIPAPGFTAGEPFNLQFR